MARKRGKGSSQQTQMGKGGRDGIITQRVSRSVAMKSQAIIKKAAKNPVLVGATGLALASGMVAVGVVLANKNMRNKVGKGMAKVGKAAGEFTQRASEYPTAVAHRITPSGNNGKNKGASEGKVQGRKRSKRS